MEGAHPVESAALGGGGTVRIHPVHTFGREEGAEGLCELFHCLVEGFRRAVAILPEGLVLCEEEALDGTHKGTSLTCEVRYGLSLEGGFEQVSRADGNTDGEGGVECLAGGILIYRERGVDTSAFEVKRTYRGAGALGSDHDHVDVLRGNASGAVIPGDGETVGEIEGLSRGEIFLDYGPYGEYGGIGEETHYYVTLFAGLFYSEERLSGYPAVRDSLVVGLAGTLSYYYVLYAVVTHIEGLSGSLYTITYYRHCLA